MHIKVTVFFWMQFTSSSGTNLVCVWLYDFNIYFAKYVNSYLAKWEEETEKILKEMMSQSFQI